MATPIGMIIGSVSQRVLESDTALLVESIFDALASGTFLYIAALEVIHQEFFHRRALWSDMVGFVIGLLIMIALAFVD